MSDLFLAASLNLNLAEQVLRELVDHVHTLLRPESGKFMSDAAASPLSILCLNRLDHMLQLYRSTKNLVFCSKMGFYAHASSFGLRLAE